MNWLTIGGVSTFLLGAVAFFLLGYLSAGLVHWRRARKQRRADPDQV